MKETVRKRLICISGIPGTGKSTVCSIIGNMGYLCVEGNTLAARYGCLSGDEVDVDCLSDGLLRDGFSGIVAAHYSHLLPCDIVVILEADEAVLRKRMAERAYPPEKIQENLDAQRSDIIYSESLDRLPATRIFRIRNTDLQATISKILGIIQDKV
ncbi:adenylate kinase family protein [Thermoplasma sp.]|uniref:AAA family ATPase n=1 Tax=Thermoplasma sp. TaxID=1973142 RepID=UPI001273B9B9|nr:adenylate kinase family protein [Thermoplasma sp.]KAA8923463.1 MAG: AAA family ATPase [Thermoplasma sp.]